MLLASQSATAFSEAVQPSDESLKSGTFTLSRQPSSVIEARGQQLDQQAKSMKNIRTPAYSSTENDHPFCRLVQQVLTSLCGCSIKYRTLRLSNLLFISKRILSFQQPYRIRASLEATNADQRTGWGLCPLGCLLLMASSSLQRSA